MKWLVKPQKTVTIGGMTFSSTEKLDIDNPEHRKRAQLYYSITEKGLSYYVDLDGNKYLLNN